MNFLDTVTIFVCCAGTRGSSGNTFQTPGNGFVKMDQNPANQQYQPNKKPNKMEQPPFNNHILTQHSDSHLSPLGHKSKQSLKQQIHPSLLQQPPGNHGNQHLLSLMTTPGGGGRSMNPGEHVGLGSQNHTSSNLPPRPHSASGNMTNSQAYVPVGSHGDQGMSYVPQQQGQYMNHLPYTQGPAPPQVFYPGGFYYFFPQQ